MAWPETVRKSDLKIDYYRGSGPGGQNKNKRDTACRMTHIPTGKVAQAEEQRTQEGNRKAAFKRLCDQLVPIMKAAAKVEMGRQELERVRTYHGIRQEVVDHRTGKKAPFNKVLNGDIDILK